jgi:hypothetical protein
VGVATRLGGSTGQSVLDDARDAFVHAMSHAVVVGAGVALVGALFALVWLPARAPAEQENDVGAAAGDGPRRGARTAGAGSPARADGATAPTVEAGHGETLTRPRSSVDAAVRTVGS